MFELVSTLERVRFLREAAELKRVHTRRFIGEYTNGQHTFNMLAMLRLLWPEAPLELVWAIVEHDVPERIVCDIASPTIHFGGFIDKEALAQTEEEVLTEVFGFHYFPALHGMNPEAYRWLKGLDLLELYLFCKDQERIGNNNLKQIEYRCYEVFKFRAKDFPSKILDVFWEAYRETRMVSFA